MILRLKTFNAAVPLLGRLGRDPELCGPAFPEREALAEDLRKAVRRSDTAVLGVYKDGELSSIAVFLILKEEKYLEMLRCVLRSEADSGEILSYLEKNFAGFHADFVFHPANRPLRDLLAGKGASFDPEQQKMVLAGSPLPSDTSGVELLSERYLDQYLAIHDDDDRYWTGRKVLEAPDRFRVFLAVDAGTVVGYLDVTHCFDENEPYELLVTEAHRRKGWGRKLLAAAVEANRPKGMMLMVNTDNTPAIALYESMGFTRVDGADSLTVKWDIP